jgi:hypothetical protein
MARAPNYNHERNERDRAKALKKAEKLAAKTSRKSGTDNDEPDAGSEVASED